MPSGKGMKGVRAQRLSKHAAAQLRPDGLLFQAVRDRKLGQRTCFLCGRRLGTRNRSDEHVIPKWVQDQFELWNQELNLLNGTGIKYRQLKIPCCKTCNNVHLSKVESAVRDAVMAGPEHAIQLDQKTLFLWLGKIFYGLLFKEHFLKTDRRRANSRRIVPRSLLDRYGLHHNFLQAARLPFRFLDDVPASILVVPVQSPSDIRFQFDFRDSYQVLAISIRLGNVGIVGALQDGGAQRKGLFNFLKRYQNVCRPLHPLQFQELTAKFFYKTGIQNRIPKFVLAESVDHVAVVQAPLGGMSLKPIWDDWNQEEYAQMLALFTGSALEQVWEPPNRVRSWLETADNEVNYFDFNAQPWPP
jgi:hypothetical protein